MKSTLTTKGFDEYLERLTQAGADIDTISDKALLAGAEILLAGMEKRAPKESGHLVNRISIIGPTRDGNYHSIKIGLFNIDRAKELYFFYQENGSARNKAHPYLRPTFDEDMSKAKKAMKDVFVERGAL